jgi:prevent-host-death family protein
MLLGMVTMNVAKARRGFAEVINRVQFFNEAVALTRNGKACAVVVPVEDFEQLRQLRRAKPASAPARSKR